MPNRPYQRASFEQDLAQVLAHDMASFAWLACRAGQRCCALVDAGPRGLVDVHWQGESWMHRLIAQYELEGTPLFFRTPEAHAAESGPWLVDLPMSPEGEVPAELLFDLAQGPGMTQALSLVASSLRPITLAKHLRSWLEGWIPADPDLPGDEAFGAVVRWFDPRIGFDMVALWPEKERRDFLRAFAWGGWDVQFNPRGFRCSEPHAPQGAHRTEPLLLDKGLLLAMVPLNQADELLAEVMEQEGAQAFAHVSPVLQRWIAFDQMQAIEPLPLADRDSRMTLLHHALTLHPGMPRLPDLHARLVKEVGAGRLLSHLLHSLPASWWQSHREAAPGVWAQWAHHFLAPLQERCAARNAGHPFTALFPAAPTAA